MKVFRLCKENYAQALDGKGAATSNNRWNSKGTRMVYTAENRALAMAEVMVHLPLHLLPPDFVIIEIEILSNSFTTLKPELLGPGWNTFAGQSITRRLGDQFIMDQEFLFMRVPSAVVPGEFNVIINPAHPEMNLVQIIDIQSFPFDIRLFNR